MTPAVTAEHFSGRTSATRCCKNLIEIAKVIAKVALRLIFVIASVVGSAAVIPASIHVYALPVITLSSAFFSGFFFPDPNLIKGGEFHPMPPLIRPNLPTSMNQSIGLDVGTPCGHEC